MYVKFTYFHAGHATTKLTQYCETQGYPIIGTATSTLLVFTVTYLPIKTDQVKLQNEAELCSCSNKINFSVKSNVKNGIWFSAVFPLRLTSAKLPIFFTHKFAQLFTALDKFCPNYFF